MPAAPVVVVLEQETELVGIVTSLDVLRGVAEGIISA